MALDLMTSEKPHACVRTSHACTLYLFVCTSAYMYMCVVCSSRELYENIAGLLKAILMLATMSTLCIHRYVFTNANILANAYCNIIILLYKGEYHRVLEGRAHTLSVAVGKHLLYP